MPRLAVVLSHPTQYYSPWFRWIRAHTDTTLRVFYLWEFGVRPTHDPLFQKTFAWDVDLLAGYDSEFVPNASRDPGTHRFLGLRNPGLKNRLAAFQPDAVLLFGYRSPSHLAVILWARLNSVPLIFRGDSHFIGRGRPGWKSRLVLRTLYAQFAAITCVGAANRDYFTALGVPEKKLFFAPHAVNAALFDPALPGPHAAAAALRDQLGLAPGTRVVLYAGKFVPAKQPLELLSAWIALHPARAALVFVGDGQEKAALSDLARGAAPGTVHFLPFANQSEMPARYLLADIFVLPSRGFYETWGLAVNEAMHLGVPCLVSDRVGCQRDLVTDGETGWVFRADDPSHLRERLAAALAADLAPIRRNVAARIAGYTYAQATAGLLDALAATTDTD
ncbi:MAG: glycosyltransferase family 4 protein [Verrucomicrobia bacterium]|nr:glycosyltransferase family 4 protein [Verrucomicrobiota bacterium]